MCNLGSWKISSLEENVGVCKPRNRPPSRRSRILPVIYWRMLGADRLEPRSANQFLSWSDAALPLGPREGLGFGLGKEEGVTDGAGSKLQRHIYCRRTGTRAEQRCSRAESLSWPPCLRRRVEAEAPRQSRAKQAKHCKRATC